MITISIPTEAGRLFEHFGESKEFTFVLADSVQRKIIDIRSIPAPPHMPGHYPRWLMEQGSTVIIANSIGRRALANFAHHEITVRQGNVGEEFERLAIQYLHGELVAVPEGTEHHQHQHGRGLHHGGGLGRYRHGYREAGSD